MLGPAKELRRCPAGMDSGQVRMGVAVVPDPGGPPLGLCRRTFSS
jgi:hypothetical protein